MESNRLEVFPVLGEAGDNGSQVLAGQAQLVIQRLDRLGSERIKGLELGYDTSRRKIS